MRTFLKLVYAVLGLVAVAAGGVAIYFLYFLFVKAPPKPVELPTPPVASAPKVQPGQAELSAEIVIPPAIRSKLPSEYIYGANLIGSRDAPNSRRSVNMETGAEPDQLHAYTFDLPEGADDYFKFTVSICAKSGDGFCGFSRAIASGFTMVHIRPTAHKIEMGKIVLTRITTPDFRCSGKKPVFGGTIIPTKVFPARPAAGKKFALLIFGDLDRGWAKARQAFKVGTEALSLNDTDNHPIFWDYDGINGEDYLLYAGPVEINPNGFPFSVPLSPNFAGRILPVVVECPQDASWKSCSKAAFPQPVNVMSIPGRYYRLIAEGFEFGHCGMENTKFYLHEFAPPDSSAAAMARDPSLPPEIIEGALY